MRVPPRARRVLHARFGAPARRANGSIDVSDFVHRRALRHRARMERAANRYQEHSNSDESDRAEDGGNDIGKDRHCWAATDQGCAADGGTKGNEETGAFWEGAADSFKTANLDGIACIGRFMRNRQGNFSRGHSRSTDGDAAHARLPSRPRRMRRASDDASTASTATTATTATTAGMPVATHGQGLVGGMRRAESADEALHGKLSYSPRPVAASDAQADGLGMLVRGRRVRAAEIFGRRGRRPHTEPVRGEDAPAGAQTKVETEREAE